jgi:hypothetical protein
MAVLDLDLDFFLSDISTHNVDGSRPSADDYAPWTLDEVRLFLAVQFGLTPEMPKPARMKTPTVCCDSSSRKQSSSRRSQTSRLHEPRGC